MSEPKQCTPTEPGLYLFRVSGLPYWFGAMWVNYGSRALCGSEGRLCFGVFPDGSHDRLWGPVEEFGEEWGERIPDNDTLKARRWVCAMDPFDRGRGEAYHCRHCGHWVTAAERMQARILSVLHAPDCPWLRAQETHDD